MELAIRKEAERINFIEDQEERIEEVGAILEKSAHLRVENETLKRVNQSMSDNCNKQMHKPEKQHAEQLQERDKQIQQQAEQIQQQAEEIAALKKESQDLRADLIAVIERLQKSEKGRELLTRMHFTSQSETMKEWG